MTDLQTLLVQCKRGSAKATRQLYELFKGKLMGLCRRYARSREEAQDVLQESFIKIFSKINHVESSEKLEGWMKSVAVRTAIDYYHKTKIHHLMFLPLSEKEFDIQSTVIPDIEKDDNFIFDLISTLPDGCRMIFNLAVVEGYDYAEISKLLEISEGTCRSQLHRAKQILQTKLNSQTLAEYYEKLA